MARSVEDVRKKIDALDREILAALNRRAELAIEVGRVKEQLGLAIEDLKREQAVMDELKKQNRGPLDAAAVGRIFRCIIEETKNVERLRTHGR